MSRRSRPVGEHVGRTERAPSLARSAVGRPPCGVRLIRRRQTPHGRSRRSPIYLPELEDSASRASTSLSIEPVRWCAMPRGRRRRSLHPTRSAARPPRRRSLAREPVPGTRSTSHRPLGRRSLGEAFRPPPSRHFPLRARWASRQRVARACWDRCGASRAGRCVGAADSSARSSAGAASGEAASAGDVAARASPAAGRRSAAGGPIRERAVEPARILA